MQRGLPLDLYVNDNHRCNCNVLYCIVYCIVLYCVLYCVVCYYCIKLSVYGDSESCGDLIELVCPKGFMYLCLLIQEVVAVLSLID